MKPVIGSPLTILMLLCLGLLAGGCATLYVQPATLQADSLEVTVTVDWPRTTNGLAIIGFPPKMIGINLKRAGRLSETMNVKLKKGKYKHTFENVEEGIEFIIEPRTFVVFEVGKGAGPYKIQSTQPPSDASIYQRGHKRALEYRNGQVRDYRLVIEIHLLPPSNRDEFLQGFNQGYHETDNSELGKKYVGVLEQALSGGVYEQAFQMGQKHANNQVTDELVQAMINRSLGLGGFELGWKAGYIEGFVQEMFKKKGGDKEDLYQEAETIYNSLKNAL